MSKYRNNLRFKIKSILYLKEKEYEFSLEASNLFGSIDAKYLFGEKSLTDTYTKLVERCQNVER